MGNNSTRSVEWRKKIQNGAIANRLIKFAMGEIEMTSAQVTAALGLMKKVVPDLQSIDMNAKHDGKITVEIVQFSDKAKS